jgi:hypothetical protein
MVAMVFVPGLRIACRTSRVCLAHVQQQQQRSTG